MPKVAPASTPETDAPVLSKGAKVAADVSALLRARNPLLWIVSKEEARVEGFLAEAAAAAGYKPRVWDAAQGVAGMDGKKLSDVGGTDIDTTLDAIRSRAEDGSVKERGVWIMRDSPTWFSGQGGAITLRKIRNLARLLPGISRDRAQAIIILSPSGTVPEELANHTTVIEWPLPDRSEIAATLEATINALPETDRDGKPVRAAAAPGTTRDQAIDAAIGLSGEEAAACFARSLVQTKKIDPILIASEKRRVITRERVLEWFEPLKGGLAAVGGLENLKNWLLKRKVAFTQAARDAKVPLPRGIMVVGMSGCGKSLLAKATATAYEMPLLRVDLGALKGKYVGDSEGNLRKVFRVAEAIGRCVLWFDEIEKALEGAISGGADGGVSGDQLGAILTWMQERKSEAFIIMTANDVSKLPPEFIRKGRFDEMFFVDLPNFEERKAVLKAALVAHERSNIKLDFDRIAKDTDKFTGAELVSLIPDAIFTAFSDNGREITTDDVLEGIKTTVPLADTAKEKVKALRDWAVGRCRPASIAAAAKAGLVVKELDIE